jgi:signal transduction histidine kinase
MTFRLWPRSLFGRMALVLSFGLVVAQGLSAWINWAERDRVLLQAAGMQPAQRIADIVRLLDSLDERERERIVKIVSVPPQAVALDEPPLSDDAPQDSSAHAIMFAVLLRTALGGDHAVRIAARSGLPKDSEFARPRMHQNMMMGRSDMMMGQPEAGGPEHMFGPGGLMLITQVQLSDGRWVTFDTQVPREATSLPARLLLTLGALLAVVLILSFIAVRWLSRPLKALADAADALGKNIRQPPLPEAGPSEVRRAAGAFNTMQSRLVRFIEDRTRILAAMSHDLKTPLTRLRLRAELLDDDEARHRFEKDLGEMQAMVTDALEALRGLDEQAEPVPVDVATLLESIQADNEEMGRSVEIEGQPDAPLVCDPARLRRCVANLVDNAVVYGRRARIRVDDSPKTFTLRICDDGPGIPEDMLERVFDPFFRLEASRSRDTGGTGLGLSIARNIARAFGGDLRLRNAPGGGLEARLTVPR